MDRLSQGAEVFFTRLIMKADDYGSFHGNPKLINAALFPLKDYEVDQIREWVRECLEARLIIHYQSEGKDYIRIENFGQRLRAMRNTFPQPADNPLTSGGQPADNGRPETKRNEVEEETETKGKDARWYESQFDEIFLEQMQITHKGKDIQQAIRESFAHLGADKIRLYNAENADCKKLLNTWLAKMNSTKKEKKPLVNLKDL